MSKTRTPTFRRVPVFAQLIKVMVVAALIAGFVGLPNAWADQNIGKAWKRFKGKLIVSSERIPTDFRSEKDMIAVLRKLDKKSVKGDEDGWTLNLIGFMSKSPKTTGVNVVFYKKIGKKREYVSNRQIRISPGNKVVATQVTVSEEDGLEKGQRYDVLIARMANGKETIYAKTVLILK